MINAKLITGPFFLPTALAVKGNTLYVANFNNGTVGKYSAKTGAVINADFITGLAKPHALALTEDTLFVGENDRVGKYNGVTGAAIDAKFITGIIPFGLAVKSAK